MDAESGFYYLRARYYDPSTDQFLSRDPAVATTREPYTYALASPLNATDPTGLYNCGIQVWNCIQPPHTLQQAWGQFTGNVTNPAVVIPVVGAGFIAGAACVLGVCEALGLVSAASAVIDMVSATAVSVATTASGVVAGAAALVNRFLPAAQSVCTKAAPDLANLSDKIVRQMARRGWSEDQIQEAFDQGEQVPASNLLRGGTAATRYIHPGTGQSVVIDDETGAVIHVGGPGFHE